jgi:hypothetical protein
MTKTAWAWAAIATLTAGCIQSPEQTDCKRVAHYVAQESGVEGAPMLILTEHEQLIGDGLRLRGIGNFKQHAYLEAYSVCKAIESGNGVKAGRL